MFTGIVEELGTVRALEERRLTVECRTVVRDSAAGDSVAVNGTCLTVVERGESCLAFDLSEETVARTGLGRLRRGNGVNLERPVTLLTRLGGHLVQGHVDGIVEIVALEPAGEGATLVVRIPPELERYVVEKGSITLDGVSLTVARLGGSEEAGTEAGIALVPHTLAATTLGRASPGEPLNLEVDVLAKYVERLQYLESSQHAEPLRGGTG
jgi:riboflavin synthase